VRTRLLIAADGAQSAVRRSLGIPMAQLETDHVALATIVETERFHEHTAAQRFFEKGPLALLPLPSRDRRHYCSIVWSSVASRTSALAALPDRAFADALEVASERRLGKIIDVDRRQTFALEQSVVASFHPQPRVLLVGDAAHVLHPLAGQGVNLGFDDVTELLRVTSRLIASDPGAPEVWRRFATERRIRAEVAVRAMDAFRRVYSADQPTFRWLRNVGVGLLDRTPLVKTQLIRQALGI
jgi:2-polyprenylphenol 6-hydroxylase